MNDQKRLQFPLNGCVVAIQTTLEEVKVGKQGENVGNKGKVLQVGIDVAGESVLRCGGMAQSTKIITDVDEKALAPKMLPA